MNEQRDKMLYTILLHFSLKRQGGRRGYSEYNVPSLGHHAPTIITVIINTKQNDITIITFIHS